MHKQEAQQELAKLIERQAELQAIIDAKPVSLLTPGNEYFFEDVFVHAGFTRFKERNAYADAFDTMLLLRQQPGTVVADECVYQYIIDTDGDHISVESWVEYDDKLTKVSPCFFSMLEARAAIEAVGEARILRMFRTLHGVA